MSKSHCSEKQSEGEVEEEGEYESEDTVKMSSLFLRNKSLKLILGKNEFHRPKPKRSKERLKIQSMLV